VIVRKPTRVWPRRRHHCFAQVAYRSVRELCLIVADAVRHQRPPCPLGTARAWPSESQHRQSRLGHRSRAYGAGIGGV